MAVGSEIRRAPFLSIPCFENSRKVFVRHRDGRVGFVVLKKHVVVRFVPFDKVVFKKQRVFLRVYDNIFNVPDVAHKQRGFSCLLFFVEVGTYPSF